ncbi:MAG: cytochrome c peroxidase [Labilithrix sp.]
MGSAKALLTIVALGLAGGASAVACDSSDPPREPIGKVVLPHDAGRDGAVALAVNLCPDGQAVDWPAAPYGLTLTSTLPPDLSFKSASSTVRLKDYFEPCAAKSRLLVIRTSAGFCGSCIWHAEHTRRLLDDPMVADRVMLLDLLVSDEDNMPATAAALERWTARIDGPGKVALDPKITFAASLVAKEPLPYYVVIDTRTMQVQFARGNPDPDTLRSRLRSELAAQDGEPKPTPAVPTLRDKLFTEDQWDLIQGMKLESAPPVDPTNEFAGSSAAATFGRKLFDDKLLSPSGEVSCASCHDAAKGFGDGVAQAVGVATGDRNTPAIALSAHARWQFWDGRSDTLWSQALGPFENDKEFASSRMFVAKQIATRYSAEYAAAFGTKYPLPSLAGLPDSGKPGEPAWEGMSAANRTAVTRVYVNAGKAIAAFERTLRLKPNALDRYAAGDTTALDAAQKKGLFTFFQSGCVQCHWGPRLTDDAFHVIRFPTGRQDGAVDRGRNEVLPMLAASEFAASSMWSDSPSSAKLLSLATAPTMEGAFKTPGLRGLPQSAPYGHGGTFKTLLEVAKHYGTRGSEVGDDKAVGDVEPWLSEFDENAQKELPAFLEILDGIGE